MTGHDSNFASSQSKSKTARHRNLRPIPPFVFEICCFKVGYFSTSYKTFNNFGTEGVEAFTAIYQNIFPLANTFAKRENVRLGQSPIGTQMVSINTFLGGVWPRH